jgi:tetratricopeptide (TPR) repeat protein
MSKHALKSFAWLLVLTLLTWSRPLVADDEHHHFDPNEKLGTVSFTVSCAGSVQKPFERGVALLHSFAYDEANEQFQQIADQDPRCAIAYWGQAMTLYHQLWSRPSAADMQKGWELIQKAQTTPAKTKRERSYIDALAVFYQPGDAKHEQRASAYAAAMKRVYESYPKDDEAAVFYALSLLSSGSDETQIENHTHAIAILNKLFAQHPDHPGVAHYLIHACDNPHFAQEGLAAARTYAGIAPSSPHALHMPSHIFARLGLWQDDIQSNLAAIAAAQKISPDFHHMMHHRIHSMDFLEYAYLQIGDDASAKALVDEVATIQRTDVDPEFTSYLDAMLAEFPAHYALERRQWKDALQLQPPANVKPYNQAITYWAQAIAAGHLHDAAAARKAVDQYDALLEATRKSDKPYYADGMKTDTDEAHAWLAFAEGKNDEALNLLRGVADKQDKLGKAEVALPAREMLADMLMEMGKPQEALTEYEKDLHTDPNRFNGLYGAARAAELTKQPEKAAGYYSQLLKNCNNGGQSDRPELARAKELLAAGN